MLCLKLGTRWRRQSPPAFRTASERYGRHQKAAFRCPALPVRRFEHRGLGWTRCDCIDADTRRRQPFESSGFRQTFHRMLACGVPCQFAAPSANGSPIVEDIMIMLPEPLRLHDAQFVLQAQKTCRGHWCQTSHCIAVGRLLGQWARFPLGTGIIDPNIQPPETRDGLFDEVGARRLRDVPSPPE